jgi:surfeit locus 1 family protein
MVVCVMVLAIWSCVRLGFWQWHKAEQKQEITRALTRHAGALTVQAQDLADAANVEALHLQTVEFKGHYLPQFSFFLDNQVEQGQAGFQVITPFLLSDQQHIVWVNRGWVPGYADHQKLPTVVTSKTEQVIKGLFWQQTKVGFRLDKPGESWQAVQPVIDFAYLRQHVPYRFPDVVLKLDPTMPEGYVRHWDVPAGQVEKHLSYAYQWFGFALASLVIGIYQMIEKRA